MSKVVESPYKEVFEKLCDTNELPIDLTGIWSMEEVNDNDFQILIDWILAKESRHVVDWSTGIGIVEAAIQIVENAVNNGNIVKPK